MAGPIALNILSNVREAVKGAYDVADATEGVTERLRDLTQEGASSSGRMEGDFRKMTAASSKASEELKSKFRAAYLEVFSGSSDAAQGLAKLADAGRAAGKTNEQVAKDIAKAYKISVADATKAVEKLDSALDDAARAAERSGKDSKSALLDIASAAKKAESAVDDIGGGAGGGRGLGKVASSAKEVQQELGQNMGEAFSSFRGELEDIGQIGQDTLGGLAATVATMGPAGLVAGAGLAAGAAGVGIFFAELEKAREKAEDLRLKALELSETAIEGGLDTDAVVAGIDRIIDRIRELEELKSSDFRFAWEEDPTQLEEWLDALKSVGQESSEVTSIIGGSSAAIEGYAKGIEKARDATYDEIEALVKRNKTNPVDGYLARVDALNKEYDAYGDILKYVKEEITLRGDLTGQTERQREVGMETLLAQKEAEEAAASAAEERAARVQSAMDAVRSSVDTAYSSMVEDATEFATAEDGALDINKWLAYVQEHAGAVAAYQANLQSLKMESGDWLALMAMPEDVRTQWVAQIASMPEEARTPFIDALDGIAGNAGSTASQSYEDAFNPQVEAEVTSNTDAAEAKVQALVKDREITVKVRVDSSEYDEWEPGKKRGRVEAVVDKSEWTDWVPGKKYGTVQTQRREI